MKQFSSLSKTKHSFLIKNTIFKAYAARKEVWGSQSGARKKWICQILMNIFDLILGYVNTNRSKGMPEERANKRNQTF